MVRIVGITSFDIQAFNRVTENALDAIARNEHLKINSLRAFASFWRKQGVDPATLIHLGVVTSFSCQWLQDYGLSIHPINLLNETALTLVNGSLVFWKAAHRAHPTREPAYSTINRLKGLDFYALLD